LIAALQIFRRISLILRGYVAATQDRVERVAAEEELRLANSRKRAGEELDSTRLLLKHTGQKPIISPESSSNILAAEYRLLGVYQGADLDAVEAAWRGLASRADPKRFPAGSEEEKKAAEILDSVNDAYARIREQLNPTEGRFGQLEL
jgi:DnaJ-domain-containing protein 1